MITYKYITNDAGVLDVVEKLKSCKQIGVDIETSGLSPYEAKICTVQLSDGIENYVINASKADIKPTLSLLTDPSILKIGQNLKFEQSFFWHYYRTEIVNLFDTYKASNLIYNGKYDLVPKKTKANKLSATPEMKKEPWKHNLYAIYLREMGFVSDLVDCQLSDWAAEELSEDQLLYASEDVAHMHTLFGILAKKLVNLKLVAIAKLEFRATLAESILELAGMPFDVEMWTALEQTNHQRLDTIHAELVALLPNPSSQLGLFGPEPINLNSPKQLLASLAKLDIHLPNTSDDTLAKYAEQHPVLELLRDYREVSKQISSFGTAYLENVNPITKRIHSSYYPFTGCGRYSSRDPNLQQLPRKKEFRQCFKAPPGYKLIIADYSGIELRGLAAVSQDETMIGLFQKGTDLHKATASFLLDIPIEDITKDSKQLGKSCNFSTCYGAGPARIKEFCKSMYNVDMTLEEATENRSSWFKLYPGVKKWHNKVFSDKARSLGMTKTPMGRIRYLDPSEYSAFANTVVQGMAADGMKIAIGNLVRELWATLGEDIQLVNVVHDECILLSKDDPEILKQGCEILQRCMEQAMVPMFGVIPVEAEAGICENWSEK